MPVNILWRNKPRESLVHFRPLIELAVAVFSSCTADWQPWSSLGHAKRCIERSLWVFDATPAIVCLAPENFRWFAVRQFAFILSPPALPLPTSAPQLQSSAQQTNLICAVGLFLAFKSTKSPLKILSRVPQNSAHSPFLWSWWLLLWPKEKKKKKTVPVCPLLFSLLIKVRPLRVKGYLGCTQ